MSPNCTNMHLYLSMEAKCLKTEISIDLQAQAKVS